MTAPNQASVTDRRAVPQPGDTITVTGVVKSVRGRGHMALVEITGGSFYVPLPGPNALPAEEIVITHPDGSGRSTLPAAVPEGCPSCGM